MEQMKLREKVIVTGMLDSGGRARLLREKNEAEESKRELQRKMWDMQEQNEAWSKAFVAGEVSRDKAQYQVETERQDMLDRLDEQEIDLAEMQFMRGAQDSELGTAREGLQALHGSLHRHERQVLQLQTQGAQKDTKIGDLEGLNFELELRLEELHAVLGRTNAEVQRQHLVLEAKDAEIRRSQQFIKDRTSGRPIKGSPMMVRDVVVPTAHGGSKRRRYVLFSTSPYRSSTDTLLLVRLRRVFSEMDHNTLAEDTDNEAVGETLWDN